MPHRGQKVLSAAFWLPQPGQNEVAACAGTGDAWGAPQEGQNLLPPTTALPQYGQFTAPGSTMVVVIDGAFIIKGLRI